MRRTYLTLIGTLISAPLVILLALSFVLAPDPEAPWGPWPVVVAALGLGGIVLAELVGYRTAPIPAGTDPERTAARAAVQWQSTAILRFVVTEAPFILTVALVFAVPTPQPVLLVALATVVAVAGMGFHLWPWSRPVTKIAEGLERDGARTTLREDLGVLTAR